MRLSRKLLPSILQAPDLGDDDSVADSTSASLHPRSDEDEERDEVKEVERASEKETSRIRLTRIVASVVLLATALAVTLTTHSLLVKEQEKNFEEAYDQFSHTVGEAAVRQQLDIHESLVTLSNTYTSTARVASTDWPNFLLPDFERHAIDTMALSSGEMLYIGNVVKYEDRPSYESFMNASYVDWVEESHLVRYGDLTRLERIAYKQEISAYNFTASEFAPSPEKEEYVPWGSFSPPPISYFFINLDGTATTKADDLYKIVKETASETIVGSVFKFDLGGLAYSEEDHDAFHSEIEGSSKDFPHSSFTHPIYDIFDEETRETVAMIRLIAAWDVSMRDLLPVGVEGIQAVLTNTCNQTYTYAIEGPDAFFLGEQDQHDSSYDEYQHTVELTDNSLDYPDTNAQCSYSLHIYPTDKFQDAYKDNTPVIFAIIVACTFVLMTFVFVVYDLFVQSRNNKIVLGAARSNAIVSSLFPGRIRDQLLGQSSPQRSSGTKSSKMKLFLSGGDGDEQQHEEGKSKPLAELFLATTVMFADIVGFTAWSSTREPAQVFELLEQVYSAFDKVAKRRRVFKVETVGDCYVAVTGLPDPQLNHATTMARFATKCLTTFRTTVKRMELSLGPDTADLDLRIGMNSGPVTAGVLRGERSRFQLFGDTMNTTARMESTSKKSRIQLSQTTADLLIKAGKKEWLVPRHNTVNAKGLGELQTYWLTIDKKYDEDMSVAPSVGSMDSVDDDFGGDLDNRQERLIDWNTGTLIKLVRQIVARRETTDASKSKLERQESQPVLLPTKNPLGEVQEIIQLRELSRMYRDPASIEIDPKVVTQLRTYVTCIAQRYKDNPFHNFEHASHVVMSVMKCLSRIIAPSELEEEMQGEQDSAAAKLHDHTYGITSDPLTQFACAFSALIHDVDHEGVPNTQLVKEQTKTATLYKERSVAEQNSLDIAWSLLMEDRFADMRVCVFGGKDDLRRFRGLVVNSVMATDIADKQLKELRNGRWQKAFSSESQPESADQVVGREAVNRKATIVIEHLIQASDISHTMQHWNVYRKWNERLFEELYLAHKAGRGPNPAEFWAKGEIGFFDFYIIPLARKLKECGVFGITSDEFLNYAMQNRKEWEERSAAIVAEMIEKFTGNNEIHC